MISLLFSFLIVSNHVSTSWTCAGRVLARSTPSTGTRLSMWGLLPPRHPTWPCPSARLLACTLKYDYFYCIAALTHFNAVRVVEALVKCNQPQLFVIQSRNAFHLPSPLPVFSVAFWCSMQIWGWLANTEAVNINLLRQKTRVTCISHRSAD